ncbi:DUF3159 domain-containing protein [Cellulomonas pakistanensis]|uniref:DUF3159 domain-containing protein n=1 Tax=Cellulomonas pakistanensis TaxID=992287 RepID=A0A919PE83_9CELL|nr:DUF3159 domain-containing protein [Cellulomonas pakistanensis]GIG38056.1 hypothetical protein Cpa01nite_34370 [Cellulomonas pakistanensis]
MSDPTAPTGPGTHEPRGTQEPPPVPAAGAPEDAVPARGMRAIEADDFSLAESVGGVRGAVESVLPGLLFVVVYVVAGQELRPALIAAVAAAVVAVVARLVQRSPLTQALSGVLGVGIGVVWAWRTGDASDYFAWGLLTNVAYLLAFVVSVLVRWPLVGLVLGLFRGDGPMSESGSWAGAVAWRRDPALLRRYALVTWLWAGMFGLRLLVQVPLYYADEVAWLGTAKLVMGVPLTALVLWASWILVRGSRAARPGRPRTPRGR